MTNIEKQPFGKLIERLIFYVYSNIIWSVACNFKGSRNVYFEAMEI